MFTKETEILIVDDMAGAREFLRTQLTGMGFSQIMEAEDGEEALTILDASQSVGMPIQLVISDWAMPNVTGLELLERLRKSSAFGDMPFLMVTAEGESSQVIKAIQAGVSDYIVKPFTSETLWKKIQAVWTRHYRA